MMAESCGKAQEKTDISAPSSIECAVCLQTCVHPAELPCGHIFCFLCIKGIAFQSGRCAMCREIIPAEFLMRPKLIAPLYLECDDTYHWYYEGYSGWWQYDQRASTEIEEAYQKGEKSCQLLLAGFLYCIDFNAMVQYRQTNPVRRRRIKRDRATTDKLGVAGLRSDIDASSVPSSQSSSSTGAIEQVEAGLQNLWCQGMVNHSNSIPQTNEHSSESTPMSPQSVFRLPRHDIENYGVESLGPEDCPDVLRFRSLSPASRDGRSFNPRLELCDAGEEESDEENEVEEEDEGPRRIFSGPSVGALGAFRPLPMRAQGRSSTEQDHSDYENHQSA